MVYLAEQGLGEKATLDTACQEMLSHATSKANNNNKNTYIHTHSLQKKKQILWRFGEVFSFVFPPLRFVSVFFVYGPQPK